MAEGKFVLGIDPGQSGGFALVDLARAQNPIIFPMADTETSCAEIIAEHHSLIVMAYIENVHSMPKQGVASSFKFGRSYGFLRGLLVGMKVPFEEVSPQKWTKALGLVGGEPGTEKKNMHKQRAQQWWPQLKITHSTADALLIAEWGRRHFSA